ncbi:uncharacterized protein LOC108632752 [Ceratina calcarata]|uniref:Uncharacterized protein LOC108632752 n=1 Tax=Ceratina calcarata TaxID=156304 RepID=A0AAJ7JHN6_9HYME|nr:uncharacterized protein LOC108632752 [Ceratina calcarata]
MPSGPCNRAIMKTHTKNEKQSENIATNKKPFDKKKYRLQKYSNKYKINQWEERRKKAILRGFYKELDKDQQQNLKTQSASKGDGHEEFVYLLTFL